jgi:hypothetical protein
VLLQGILSACWHLGSEKNAKILKKMLAKFAPACIIDNRFESSFSSYTVLVLVRQLFL